MQSRYLALQNYSMPYLKEINVSMEIDDSSEFLPAFVALEWLTGRKPDSILDPKRQPSKAPVVGLNAKLTSQPMYSFYDNLFNIYVPYLANVDRAGDDPILKDAKQLCLENILESPKDVDFTLINIHLLPPFEREKKLFAGIKKSKLNVNIKIGNVLQKKTYRPVIRQWKEKAE